MSTGNTNNKIVSEYWGEDPEVLELVVDYLASFDARLGRLRELRQRQDYHMLAREAHALKGTSGLLGYPSVSSLAKQLEEAAKAGDDESCEVIILELSEIKAPLLAGVAFMQHQHRQSL